jgi:hypothetical protein
MTWKQEQLKRWRIELTDVKTIIAFLEDVPADFPGPLNANFDGEQFRVTRLGRPISQTARAILNRLREAARK